MRLNVPALLLGLCLSAFSALPAMAWEREFPAGSWYGYATFDDETNVLDTCMISSAYEGGYLLEFFMMADFSVGIAITRDGWQLATNATFPLDLSVDRRWERSLSGLALDHDTVVVFLGDDLEGYQALRQGYVLTVYAARDTMQFNLTGTANALAATAQCVLANASSGGGSDPFSIESNPFAEGPSQTSPVLGSETVTGFLIAAGLDDAVLLTEAERAEIFPDIDYAWQLNNVVGSLAVFEDQEATPDQMVAAFVSGIAEECPSRFSSGTKAGDGAGEMEIRRFFTACTDGGEEYSVHGTLAAGSSGAVVISHFAVGGAGADAAAADEMIAEALRTIGVP